MNAGEFNILAEKIYPDTKDRENAEYACKMITATEQLMNAEKRVYEGTDDSFKDAHNEIRAYVGKYKSAEKKFKKTQAKIRTYLDKYNDDFPGSFLIQRNDRMQAELRELINFTFDETKRLIYTDKEKEMLKLLLTDKDGKVIRP